MIDGVKTKKLKVIPDERGRLMEILRSDEQCLDSYDNDIPYEWRRKDG